MVVTINPPTVPTIAQWTAQLLITFDRLAAGGNLTSGLIPALRNRLEVISAAYNTTRAPSRVRRGILNFVGDLSSKLFGTATESEIEGLQTEVQHVQQREATLYHNQEKLVSVVNKTRQQAVINHQDIVRLSSNVQTLSNTIMELKKRHAKYDAITAWPRQYIN